MTGTGTHTGTDAETDTGTDASADISAEAGAETSGGTDTGTGAETDADVDTDMGADVDADKDADKGADKGAEVGTLVLAGTPIGDVTDAPPRLVTELANADVIAAEDTRRLRRLTQALQAHTRGRIVSYFEGNESAKTPELVEALAGGARVLLVTDAGMPSVSDPGYRLVAAAVERGIRVTAVPGPSAVLTALALSGLPVDRFCFEGFLPRKPGERLTRLREAAGERRTLVYFESPRRLDATLAAMAEVFGADRRAAVCRELTKTYEEVKRGGLGELADWAADGVRGEITVVVSGAPEAGPGELDPAELVRRVRDREEAGERRKEAIAAVAAEAGLPKREVFDAVVASKNAARAASANGKGLS
ncbi:16S rRNA (cytidine(1402)-2'-O)-methyltransferase [Streptomyces sp. NPDC004749]